MNDFSIRKSVYIDANPEAVYDALTSPDAIVNYLPIRKVTSEWRVGGELLLDGEIDGNPFRDHGLIEVLSRPVHFQYSYWSTNHGTERTPENHSTISYRLSPRRTGTQLDLEHTHLRLEHKHVMDTVWDSLLSSLREYVERRP
jgi:uncharacterized protein YndB with AHSA1/START domain